VTEALAMPPSGAWTLEDLLRLPEDGNRYEIVDGSLLVSPPPTVLHGVAVATVVRLLQDSAPPDLVVLPGGPGVALRRSLYIPDALVVEAIAVAADRPVFAAAEVRLVVEVLSPSNRTTDLVTKRADYAAAGIPSYWLVDPAAPSLTVLRLEGTSYVEKAVVRGDEAYAGTEPFPVTVLPSALRRPPRRAG